MLLPLRAESGTRTRDLFITNELLYQLSHFGIIYLSLLSDSNQRPRDYKSRALAN